MTISITSLVKVYTVVRAPIQMVPERASILQNDDSYIILTKAVTDDCNNLMPALVY